ncbi:MAG TPA: HipA domain-containing protein [Candidatus Nitrosotenuis sp.]|jgi:serine/threonine-protein kinase HipA|nr:HipA domain-containing protein [Candidatus Nitrosotenuis sp.]
MKRCLITYLPLIAGLEHYSPQGLRQLSPRLNFLKPFPYSAEAQRQEAMARATKLSIQGVQPKLSATLSVAENSFILVDKGGRFIVKPQHDHFPELPQNEDVTMRLAAQCGIKVPVHGLLFCKDESLSYFIKRFDRIGSSGKIPTEDFAQLSHHNRDTKYNSSMEQVAKIIQTYCTFPMVESQKLLLRVLFCFIVGNEDMHLKNFSVISQDGKIELSPAYDLLNTTIIFPHGHEEIALPIRGKKNKLTKADLLTYFGAEILKLPDKIIQRTLTQLIQQMTKSLHLIDICFLSDSFKMLYKSIIQERINRLVES